MTVLGSTVPYYGGKQVANPANVIATSGAPSSAITASNGTLAVDNASGTMYGAVSQSGGIVTWAVLGGGSGAVASITTQDSNVVVPTGGTINVIGTGSIATTGAGSTATIGLTGLTNFNVLVGAGTATITKVAPSATSGVALISQGAASNPVFGTVAVAGGGTGAVTLTGVLTGNGTSPVTASAVTQYALLVGDAANAIASVADVAIGQVLMSGGVAANPAYSASPSVTGSVTAGTTLTATLGAITATNGNFVGSTAGTGLLFNANTATGAAASPVVLNSRAGQVTFTSVSIAAAADLTLTITNSEITGASTQVIYSMSGSTTGSAPSIKSVTNSAGSSAIVVTNGTGATTTTADIVMNFIVVN